MRATWRKAMDSSPCYQQKNSRHRKPCAKPKARACGANKLQGKRLCPAQTPRTDGLRAQSVQQETRTVPTHVVPHGLELLGQQAHLVRHRALLQGQCRQLLPQACQLGLQPPQLLHEALPEGLLGRPTPKERSVSLGSLVRGKATSRKAQGAPRWLQVTCPYR